MLAADGSLWAGMNAEFASDDKHTSVMRHTAMCWDVFFTAIWSRFHFGDLTVLGVLIYVLGIVQIYYPDKVYFFLRRWQFQNAELSDEGRTVTVIGGVIICIIGIGVMSGLILYLIK